jgi:hypothetical protein
MPNAAILWPVRREDLARTTEAATYTLRVTVNGVTANLTFPATGALAAGRNYWMSGDAQADASTLGGVGDTVALLRACLASHSQAPTVSIAVSATGVLTITSSLAMTILWSHANTTLSALPFGWTQVDTASSTTLAAPNQAWGWYALDRPWSDDTRWQQPIARVARASLSGLVRVSRFGLPARMRTLTLVQADQANTLREYAAATRPRGTFEDLWLDGASLGRELRIYDDAATRTSSSYTLGLLAPDVADQPHERDADVPTLWTWRLDLMERT